MLGSEFQGFQVGFLVEFLMSYCATVKFRTIVELARVFRRDCVVCLMWYVWVVLWAKKKITSLFYVRYLLDWWWGWSYLFDSACVRWSEKANSQRKIFIHCESEFTVKLYGNAYTFYCLKCQCRPPLFHLIDFWAYKTRWPWTIAYACISNLKLSLWYSRNFFSQLRTN